MKNLNFSDPPNPVDQKYNSNNKLFNSSLYTWGCNLKSKLQQQFASMFPYGTELYWKDVFFPQGSPKATGAGNPSLVNWIGNLNGYAYSIGDGYDADPQEFPHDGRLTSTAYLHMHLISRTAVVGDKIKMQAEYTIANIGATFPATTTISGEYTVGAGMTAPFHIFLDLGTFALPNIGALMSCRISRISKSAGGTDPAVAPVVLGLHYHYQVDTPGSRQIITK